MYKRVFTFGCSFTDFMWPTWADILIRDLGVESYNYGLCGLGNVGIMHEVVRADLKHKFTEDDAIFIVWSSWSREDRWINGEWGMFGNIFTCGFFDKKFIKKYWHPENDVVKNATAIISTNKMYRDLIKFQGHMNNPSDQFSHLTEFSINHEALQELYDFYLSEIPTDNVFNHTKIYKYDGHPSILDHIDYLEENVYPAIGAEIKTATVDHYKELDERIRDLPMTESTRWNTRTKKIAKLIKEEDK